MDERREPGGFGASTFRISWKSSSESRELPLIAVKENFYALFLVLSFVPLFAARNWQRFFLPSDVRVGDVQLRGERCDVTWTEASGSRLRLTIKADDKKTISIPERVIEGEQLGGGVEAVFST